jgi:hypothetical protein
MATQNVNSLTPFSDAKVKEVHEGLGVTQLIVGGDQFAWHQTVGGLLWQGGYSATIHTDTTRVIPFLVPYQSKVLWIGISVLNTGTGMATTVAIPVGSLNLVNFTVAINTEGILEEDIDVWWIAVGV